VVSILSAATCTNALAHLVERACAHVTRRAIDIASRADVDRISTTCNVFRRTLAASCQSRARAERAMRTCSMQLSEHIKSSLSFADHV
jgi:hypothetical protein